MVPAYAPWSDGAIDLQSQYPAAQMITVLVEERLQYNPYLF